MDAILIQAPTVIEEETIMFKDYLNKLSVHCSAYQLKHLFNNFIIIYN